MKITKLWNDLATFDTWLEDIFQGAFLYIGVDWKPSVYVSLRTLTTLKLFDARRAKMWLEASAFAPQQELVNSILQRYSRNGVDVRSYSIARDYGLKRIYQIYPDAEFGFNLILDGQAIGGIWWNIEREGEILFVQQIQGGRGKKGELRNFRWERMLLRFLIEWARTQGVREIRTIQSGGQRYYFNSSVEQRDRFHLLYDVTPRREGFTPGKGYHSLLLPAIEPVWI